MARWMVLQGAACVPGFRSSPFVATWSWGPPWAHSCTQVPHVLLADARMVARRLQPTSAMRHAMRFKTIEIFRTDPPNTDVAPAGGRRPNS